MKMTEVITVMSKARFNKYIYEKATSMNPIIELELDNFDDEEIVIASLLIAKDILIINSIKKMRSPEDWKLFV